MPALSDTKLKVTGDLIKYEANQMYTRVSSTVKNNEATTTAAIPDPIGYPVKLVAGVWTLCQDTQEASCDGLIAEGPPIESLAAAAVSANKYSILCRGPAVIDQNQIPAADSQGSAYTLATFVTRLETAIPVPIVCTPEPTKSSTQST